MRIPAKYSLLYVFASLLVSIGARKVKADALPS